MRRRRGLPYGPTLQEARIVTTGRPLPSPLDVYEMVLGVGFVFALVGSYDLFFSADREELCLGLSV